MVKMTSLGQNDQSWSGGFRLGIVSIESRQTHELFSVLTIRPSLAEAGVRIPLDIGNPAAPRVVEGEMATKRTMTAGSQDTGGKRRRKAPAKALPVTSKLPFLVVGVGASAGGLEACTALLSELPADIRIAIVVVQHLDPTRKSLLCELLSRVTEMPVADVKDGVMLEPCHVYVLPADRDMTVRNGTLRLSNRQQSGGKHLPIDRFLTSLASDQRNGAVGVILSGTGSDGTAGLEAIKAEGGITFAQNPRSAQHSGMPESAIDSECVDFILSPVEIARELVELARSPHEERAISIKAPQPENEGAEDLHEILQILRAASTIDFCLYKVDTIRRRVARRMALHKIENLTRYAFYLQQNPTEVQALCQDVLIHVTSFFREPEVFAALQSTVFPKLASSKPKGEPVRIWVPGCATGEEAYSIAIALLEFLGNRADDGRCQVFATDVSSAAVDKARLGVYSEAEVAGVSPERLARFFVKVGTSYQITKQVRDLCVFARHNLGKDPPFSRLDLVSCRNVLIYLGPVLQRRVLSIFHYALRPHGFLLLGKAESLGPSAHLFTPVDRKRKIYLRNPVPTVPLLDMATAESGDRPLPESTRGADSSADLRDAVEAIVWRRQTLAAFVVDVDLQIIHFQGNTGPYLEPTSGPASLHLFKLVREGLVLDLRAALHKAKKDKSHFRREGIRIAHEDGFKIIDLEVIPIRDRHARWPDFLILIEEARRKPAASTRSFGGGEVLASLKHELASTREELQSIIEGQEATNEELETAQEELQSSNEELTTLNDELQSRNAELGQLADDLSNLLVGVDIPIVILGADRRIRRFTPAAEPLLNLIPTDVGRPIGDIRPNIDVPGLDGLISKVIERTRSVEREVQGKDGRWYSLRMRPHKGAQNRIEGVLIALMDIDAMKRGLDRVRSSRDEAVAERDLSAKLLDLSGALVVVRDADGRTIGFNRACQESSGYSFEEVRNKPLWSFLFAPEEAEEAKAQFAAIRDGVKGERSYETSWITMNGTRRVIAWSSLAHRTADGSGKRVISTGVDITRRTLMENELRQSRENLRRLTAGLISSQEEERKRLARELHDDVNQRMAMLAIEVDLLGRDLPGAAGSVHQQIQSLRQNLEQLSDDLRRAAHQLHPSDLEHFGLVAALEGFCSTFSRLHSIRLRFTHRGVPDSMPSEVALCLYRVAQECLHNVAKHSGASKASLALKVDKGDIVLSVADKGAGFDPAPAGQSGGLGLIGIRERVRLVGGRISIRSSPDNGAQIEVRVRLAEAPQ
ncbi:MAG: PAS domain-containing protein [Bryobacteraceae bacterium]|nr:PAS domain-containing protein [Bryobacteraceae bacterium]